MPKSMIRRRGCSLGVALVAFTVVACAGDRRPPVTPKRPIPPISVARLTLTQPAAHYLSFTMGQTLAVGAVLSFDLLDRFDRRVAQARRRIGPVAAGQPQRLQLVFAADRRVRLVGRSRMGATPKAHVVDLSPVVRARLVGAGSCWQETYQWRAGMPVPANIRFTPREGERLQRLRCDRPLADPTLQRTLRYVRVADRSRASLRVDVLFNRDYELGATLRLQLADERGAALPCQLEIKQPTVWEGQRKRYAMDLSGAAVISTLAPTARATVASVEPQQTLERYTDVRLLCRGAKALRGRGVAPRATPHRSPAHHRRGGALAP